MQVTNTLMTPLNNKYVLAIWISLLIFLVGCASNGALSSTTQTPTRIGTKLTTQEIIPTEIATNSPPIPTATLFIETPTVETIGKVEADCVQILTGAPKDKIFQGLAVFYNPEGKNYELYDLKTGVEKEIAGKGNRDLSVSPNRKAYAYHNIQSNQLLVFSSAGQLLHTLVWKKDWGYVGNWIDDERILIELSKPDQSRPTYDEYPRTLLILNPVTGEQKVYPPNFPDIDKAANIEWDGFGSTVYDPLVTRVIYPANVKGNSAMSYILWDVPGNREIKQLQLPVALGGMPRWFTDGTKFILNGHDGEFYVVNRDGEVSQITHVNSGTNGSKFSSRYYSWSPDGKTVALWLESTESKSTHIALLDVDNQKIKDLCIPAGYNPMRLEYTPIPVWSPDGKYLLIEADNQENGESDVVVVDVEAQTAQKIASNRNPLGWIVLP